MRSLLFVGVYRTIVIAAILTIGFWALAYLQVLQLPNGSAVIHHHDDFLSLSSPSRPDEALSLPPEYTQAPVEELFCAERFGIDYLQNLAKAFTSYCDADSRSNLTCFHTKVDPKGRIDSFCIGGPVHYHKGTKNYQLDCQPRQ